MNDAIKSNENPYSHAELCDRDGFCESSYGETYETCPSDCLKIIIRENT